MSETGVTAPLLCVACGAPLVHNKMICPYCRTPWVYTERYHGPIIPDGMLHYSQSISYPSTASVTYYANPHFTTGTIYGD